MKVLFGNTRFVLLTNKNAIKFARIRPLKAILWLLEIITGYIKYSEDQKNKSIVRILVGITLCGLMSNRREYHHSLEYSKDTRFEQIQRMFFGGLIVVQLRGEEATQNDLSCWMKSFFPYYKKGLLGIDLDYAKQFAWFGNKLKLIDIGNSQTVEVLRNSYKTQP